MRSLKTPCMIARSPLKILLENFPEQADDFLEHSPPPRDGPGKLLIRHVEIASSLDGSARDATSSFYVGITVSGIDLSPQSHLQLCNAVHLYKPYTASLYQSIIIAPLLFIFTKYLTLSSEAINW